MTPQTPSDLREAGEIADNIIRNGGIPKDMAVHAHDVVSPQVLLLAQAFNALRDRLTAPAAPKPVGDAHVNCPSCGARVHFTFEPPLRTAPAEPVPDGLEAVCGYCDEQIATFTDFREEFVLGAKHMAMKVHNFALRRQRHTALTPPSDYDPPSIDQTRNRQRGVLLFETHSPVPAGGGIGATRRRMGI